MEDIAKHISGLHPEDLMMTPMQAVENKMGPIWDVTGASKTFLETKRYVGYTSDRYADEDHLDQEICIGGKVRGLDIIVLTHMPGMFQVVTEILDCQDRGDSFRSLLYLED